MEAFDLKFLKLDYVSKPVRASRNYLAFKLLT